VVTRANLVGFVYLFVCDIFFMAGALLCHEVLAAVVAASKE